MKEALKKPKKVKEEILSNQRYASKEASLLAIIAKESSPIGLTNPLVEE